jgi:LmbE family N-acetylglucosaminyl deacetylase
MSPSNSPCVARALPRPLSIVLAHPDDEDNGLVAALARGLGARVVVCTATRGEGGQNEIGPNFGVIWP